MFTSCRRSPRSSGRRGVPAVFGRGPLRVGEPMRRPKTAGGVPLQAAQRLARAVPGFGLAAVVDRSPEGLDAPGRRLRHRLPTPPAVAGLVVDEVLDGVEVFVQYRRHGGLRCYLRVARPIRVHKRRFGVFGSIGLGREIAQSGDLLQTNKVRTFRRSSASPAGWDRRRLACPPPRPGGRVSRTLLVTGAHDPRGPPPCSSCRAPGRPRFCCVASSSPAPLVETLATRCSWVRCPERLPWVYLLVALLGQWWRRFPSSGWAAGPRGDPVVLRCGPGGPVGAGGPGSGRRCRRAVCLGRPVGPSCWCRLEPGEPAVHG